MIREMFIARYLDAFNGRISYGRNICRILCKDTSSYLFRKKVYIYASQRVRGLIFIIITYLVLFFLTIVLESIFIPVSYEQKLKFILSV